MSLHELSLEKLCKPHVLLRPVEQGTVSYLEMVDSIRTHGVLNSILARPHPTKPGFFEICDGMWRFTAAREVGLTTVPCVVREMDDTEFLALQVQANALTKATSPLEYSRRLNHFVDTCPDMNLAILSRLVGKSVPWVRDNMNLVYLTPEEQTLVERGDIPLQSAILLSKIPPTLRGPYVALARELSFKDFAPTAKKVIKGFRLNYAMELSDRHKANAYAPKPHLRTLKELLSIIDDEALATIVINANNCRTKLEVWKACLLYVTNQDSISKDSQKTFTTREIDGTATND